MAQPAAAAAQAQAALLLQGQRQLEQSRLPLWTGSKDKDVFTAEQWIERVHRCRESGRWDAQTTMSYVFNALRGDALTWFDALPVLGFDREDWEDFRTAF